MSYKKNENKTSSHNENLKTYIKPVEFEKKKCLKCNYDNIQAVGVMFRYGRES